VTFGGRFSGRKRYYGFLSEVAANWRLRPAPILRGVVQDAEFAGYGAERLAGRPGVIAVAGVPTYIVAAELAVNVVLRGELPSPGGYPAKLRETAHRAWLADALRNLGYARRC
jgi:hypothetical protein